MKRVLKPAGQLLVTAAFGSLALDMLALAAIAQPESVPVNPPTPTPPTPASLERDLEEIPAPVASSVTTPEALPSQEFSQPAPSSELLQSPVAPLTEENATLEPSPDLPTSETLEQLPQPPSRDGSAEASSETSNSTVLQASTLNLQEHLAAMVERDRPVREARLRENLAIAALYYAQVGDFEQARQTAQHLALPLESQATLLAQIEALEAQMPETVVLTPTPEPEVVSSAIAQPPLNIRDQIPIDYLQSLQASPPAICNPTEIDQIATPFLRMKRQYPDMLYSLVERAQQYRVKRNIGKCVATTATPIAYRSPDQLFLMQVGQGITMTYPLAILAEITSRFGWRIHPITGDRRFHAGVDLGAPYGTPVVAALTGHVVSASFMDGYGLTVVLEHPSSAQRTLYAHLSGIAVEPGTLIEQGQVIGWVGSTGNSTGPHLHFEVQTLATEGWVAIDPMPPQSTTLTPDAHAWSMVYHRR